MLKSGTERKEKRMKVIQIREDEVMGTGIDVAGGELSGVTPPTSEGAEGSLDYQFPPDNLDLPDNSVTPSEVRDTSGSTGAVRWVAPPPPPPDMYFRNLAVPYYIPVGINPYREPYNTTFRRSKREYGMTYKGERDFEEEREWSYEQMKDGIKIRARGKEGGEGIVKVWIGRMGSYYRKFNRSAAAKEMYFRLADTIEREPEEMIAILIRYKFKRKREKR